MIAEQTVLLIRSHTCTLSYLPWPWNWISRMATKRYKKSFDSIVLQTVSSRWSWDWKTSPVVILFSISPVARSLNWAAHTHTPWGVPQRLSTSRSDSALCILKFYEQWDATIETVAFNTQRPRLDLRSRRGEGGTVQRGNLTKLRPVEFRWIVSRLDRHI